MKTPGKPPKAPKAGKKDGFSLVNNFVSPKDEFDALNDVKP